MIKKRLRENSPGKENKLSQTLFLRKNPMTSKASLNESSSPKGLKLLYPNPPKLPSFRDTTVINLLYKNRKLPVKLPLYVQTRYLEYLFHQELHYYEKSQSKSQAVSETAKTIGFESTDNDILLDYRISLGNGILDRTVDFRCLKHKSEGTLEKYKILKCLAIGGFSKVYLVRSLADGKFYAMKVMAKKFIFENEKQTIIYNEKEICQAIKHPFIVKLNHCFETRQFLCFVFDYCPGGELFFYLKKIKRMTEQQAKFYFIEILYGLQYLHEQGIIYRDLKPENLLIDADGHIKIADFGLSKGNIQPDSLTYSFCGSAEYMPPEMILKTGHSFGVDFYTLGALLYELVTGLPPFYSRDEQQIKNAIVNQQLTFPSRVQLSNEIKLLLKGLLAKNQKLRLGSLKGIKEILFHPWLGRVNSEQILSKQLTPPYVPDINEFNFDENELGDDQPTFTAALLDDSCSRLSKKDRQFGEFDYTGDINLSSQQKSLLAQADKIKALQPAGHSISSMKSRTIHRQSSSPYLNRSQSKKRLSHQVKSIGHVKKCSSLKSLSKKKGKSYMQTADYTSFKKNLRPVFSSSYFLGERGLRKHL